VKNARSIKGEDLAREIQYIGERGASLGVKCLSKSWGKEGDGPADISP